MGAVAWLVTDGDWRRAYTSEEAADALIDGAMRSHCRPLFKVPLYADIGEPRYRLTPKGEAALKEGREG